jgi:hypothetical protein
MPITFWVSDTQISLRAEGVRRKPVQNQAIGAVAAMALAVK